MAAGGQQPRSRGAWSGRTGTRRQRIAGTNGYMEAISPQKISGRSDTSNGPGRTPWMRSAAKIRAMKAFPGMPRASTWWVKGSMTH